GDVTADGTERAHKLAGGEAGDGGIGPGKRKLALGESADLLGRGGDGVAQRGIKRVPRGGHLLAGNAQRGRTGERVELRSVAKECAVTAPAHGGDDAAHGRRDAVERCG